jgi:3-deoxy-7-phosphoheptulonate synthase
MASLERLRKKVRRHDRKLMLLLRKRMELTKKIGKKKNALGIPVKDPAVERAVIENALESGKVHGLSPRLVESIMHTVISESRLRQEALHGAGKKGVEKSGPTAGDSPEDQNIASSRYLQTPHEFISAIPPSKRTARTVAACRNDIRRILSGKDGRMLIIMGPCSVHDIAQAEEYATRMRNLMTMVDDRFLLVMRTNVEKSRTGRGWTGFLTDPHLDGSGDVHDGITLTRMLLNRLGELGIPASTEFINPMTPLYIGDLVSWATIGARTSGSQMHRDMASGLSMPMGFKNGTDGNINIALDAIISASSSHHILSVDNAGNLRVFKTRGNRYCHLILRGGERPNYDEKNVRNAQNALRAAGLPPRLVIDCSHGNSGKLARNQIKAFNDLIAQRARGNNNIVGIMLESHLNAGKQRLPEELAGFNPSALRYGVSVTDECLGWDATEKLVIEAHKTIS